jgi:hypothetical protein
VGYQSKRKRGWHNAAGKWIEAQYADGRRLLYTSIKSLSADTGWARDDILKAVVHGTEVAPGVKLVFVKRVLTPPKIKRVSANTYMHWNVLVGMRVEAERRQMSLAEYLRHLIFLTHDERELFDTGAADPRGIPEAEFASVRARPNMSRFERFPTSRPSNRPKKRRQTHKISKRRKREMRKNAG